MYSLSGISPCHLMDSLICDFITHISIVVVTCLLLLLLPILQRCSFHSLIIAFIHLIYKLRHMDSVGGRKQHTVCVSFQWNPQPVVAPTHVSLITWTCLANASMILLELLIECWTGFEILSKLYACIQAILSLSLLLLCVLYL